MIIQKEALWLMVNGAAELFYEEKMHRFCRHTEKQIAYYSRNEGALIRALAPAGICIDLETDAETLSFSYQYMPGSSRNVCRFDVQVDGKNIASPGEDGCVSGEGEISVCLPEGSKRLTVWMPCLKRIWISDVTLEGASFARPCAEKEILLTLGDSITQGYDAVHPSGTYTALLAKALNMQLINQSVGGAVFDPMTLEKIPGREPQIVTCWYGTNDWNGRQREEFLREMKEYIGKLAETYHTSRIFVITPLWRADAEARGETACGTFEQVAEDICQACQAYQQIEVIHGADLMPHEASLFADGYLHPNDDGFGYIAEELVSIVKKC